MNETDCTENLQIFLLIPVLVLCEICVFGKHLLLLRIVNFKFVIVFRPWTGNIL